MSEVRETWGAYAAAFAAEQADATKRESIRRLVELCSLQDGTLVLDVAAGAGYTGFAFANTGCRVVYLDPTHEMLLATRSGAAERSLPDALVVESWAEALAFRGGLFDAVVSHRAPHQFADRAAFVAECRRILRPGGILGIADQSPPDGWQDWHNDLERMRDPTHERSLSSSEWRALVEDGGFDVVSQDVVHQTHDVEDWCDRVDCPEDRRVVVRHKIEVMPDALRQHYAPRRVEGRLVYRVPQAVVVARPR